MAQSEHPRAQTTRGVNTQAAGEPQFPKLQPEMLSLTVLCQKRVLCARM